jgi:nitrogen fixation NifU-like protein
MSELLKGKSIDEANQIINDFYEMVKGNEIADEERMDEAIAYKSVSQFPARIKCATLAWKAIEEALKQNKE